MGQKWSPIVKCTWVAARLRTCPTRVACKLVSIVAWFGDRRKAMSFERITDSPRSILLNRSSISMASDSRPECDKHSSCVKTNGRLINFNFVVFKNCRLCKLVFGGWATCVERVRNRPKEWSYWKRCDFANHAVVVPFSCYDRCLLCNDNFVYRKHFVLGLAKVTIWFASCAFHKLFANEIDISGWRTQFVSIKTRVDKWIDVEKAPDLVTRSCARSSFWSQQIWSWYL